MPGLQPQQITKIVCSLQDYKRLSSKYQNEHFQLRQQQKRIGMTKGFGRLSQQSGAMLTTKHHTTTGENMEGNPYSVHDNQGGPT